MAMSVELTSWKKCFWNQHVVSGVLFTWQNPIIYMSFEDSQGVSHVHTILSLQYPQRSDSSQNLNEVSKVMNVVLGIYCQSLGLVLAQSCVHSSQLRKNKAVTDLILSFSEIIEGRTQFEAFGVEIYKLNLLSLWSSNLLIRYTLAIHQFESRDFILKPHFSAMDLPRK